MRNLLEIREWYRQMYSRHGAVIEAGAKFLAVLLSVIMINSSIGAMSVLKNPVVVIGVSLVCAVVPKSLMVLILAMIIVAHIYAISMETAAFVLVVLLIMFMLFFRFSAGDSFVLILVPVLFLLKIPFVVPIAIGLLATPFSMVSVAFGTMLYFIMDYISTNKSEMMSAASTDGTGIMSDMANSVFTNQSMYLIIIAFCVVIAAVYVIRKLSAPHSWLIAVGAGTIIDLVIMIIGSISFGVGDVLSVPAIIIGNIISMLLAALICLMVHNVDYARTENVQFEDDDYYYYVKAVPKVKASVRGRKSGRRYK